MTRSQEIRHETLLQLHGSGRIPIAPAHIVKIARREGFDYTEAEVRDALFFLHGQGLAAKLTDPSTGETRYQITSPGILHFERED